jgi:CRISPR-associated protein Cas2
MADPVWLLLMFDLPVLTKEQRRGATRYRKMLLDLGFNQVQLSVYAKYMLNGSGVRGILPWVKESVPAQGEVRMLRLTDDQWASTYRYYGPKLIEPEGKPQQLGLFVDVE